jgi:multidrug resistance protein
MFAPGIPEIMVEFKSSSTITATFLVSIYILGFAFGPLLIAPLSEIYGRRPLYIIGNATFAIFTVGTALSNSVGMLLAFRLLMGLAGSVPITIGSGSVSDMMPVEKRGRALSAWALGPLLGPCIGPVAGGYLIAAAGWRWVFWLIVMLVSKSDTARNSVPGINLTSELGRYLCPHILLLPQRIVRTYSLGEEDSPIAEGDWQP